MRSAARVGAGLLGLCLAVALAAQAKSAWYLLRFDGQLGAADARPVVVLYAALLVPPVLAAALGNTRVRSVAVGAAAALLAVAVLVVAFGGGEWPGLLVAAAMLGAAATLGRVTWAQLAPAFFPPGRRFAELAIGLGLAGAALVVLARTALLRWWIVGPALALLAAPAAARAGRAARREGRRWLRDATTSRLSGACLAALLVTGAFVVVWTAAPEIQFDAIWFKEWLAARYAETHHIGADLAHPNNNLHGIATVLGTAGQLFGVEIGRWLQLGALTLTVALLWTAIPGAGGGAAVAAVLVGTTPHLLWQATTAYDDVLAAFCAACLALLVLDAGRGGAATLPILGLAAGTAVSFKYTLVVLGGAVLVGAAVVVVRRAADVRRLAWAGLAAIIVAAPLPLVRLVDTGNPLYPLYNAVFRSDYYPPVNWDVVFPYYPSAGLDGLAELAPWRLPAATPLFMEGTAEGAFGLLLLPLLVFLLVGWSRAGGATVVWAGVAVFTVVWWAEFRYLRFLVPACVTAVVVLLHMHAARRPADRPGRISAGLAAGAVAATAVGLFISFVATTWNVPGRIPLAVASGAQSEPGYLDDALPEHEVLERLADVAGPGDRVITDSPARLYARADLDLTSAYEFTTIASLRRGLLTWSNVDELARELDAAGFRWIMIREFEDPSGWFSGLLPELLQAHGEQVVRTETAFLYRLST